MLGRSPAAHLYLHQNPPNISSMHHTGTHTSMEFLWDAEKMRRASKFSQDSPQQIMTDGVKCLCKVDEGSEKVAMFSLDFSWRRRKRPSWGRPRTSWRDYTSDFAWSVLGVEPAELSKIAVDREVFWVLLGLLPLQHSPEEERVWKLMN